MDLTTDEVWELLSSFPPAWGGDNSRLVKLYRDAAGGECPIVLSQEDAPGCGTNSSRFGCWTCTVVEKDRSLQGFVANGRLVPGPFTVAARQMILERLQATEKAYGARLISDAEIEAIHRAWAEDLIQQNQREYISE